MAPAACGAKPCGRRPRPASEGSTVKVLEVTNVDFSLRHFLLPLMRGLRARGHEVVGACAEGPLLDCRGRRGSGCCRRQWRAA
jgi:hypothetical protein